MMDTDSACMAINAARAKPLANVSNVMLADQLGDIDRELDALKQRQTSARDEMTRRRLKSVEGVRYIIVKALASVNTFDSKAVRAEMGDDWYEARQKPGHRTTYTAIAKPPESNPASDPPLTSARMAAEALFRAPRPRGRSPPCG